MQDPRYVMMMYLTYHPKRKYIPLGLAIGIGVLYIMFFIFGYILDTNYDEYYLRLIKIAMVFYSMLCWSLYKAARSDPGFIANQPRDPENIQQQYIENPDNEKLCIICNIQKPERSHHCSKCNRCVLNMDHHCIWTAQCVGIQNRKPFVLVLFYGSAALFMAGMFGLSRVPTLFYAVIDDIQKDFYFFTFARHVFTGFMYIGTSLNFIGLFYFFCYHMKLLVKNQTTLDFLMNPAKSNDPEYKKEKKRVQQMYNLGCFRNVQFYFGKNILLWPLPIGQPLGDGIHWEKGKGFEKLESYNNNSSGSNSPRSTDIEML